MNIVVIGSINTDLVVNTDKIPSVGETVEGKEFIISFGGKGANVAVSASRLGESVNLLSCVGDDIFSKNALANLQEEGVHITAVKQIKNEKCGFASITLSNRNNQIIVVPGANAKVDTKYIKQYTSRIKECGIIGAQFEIPIESVLLASRICKENNIKFVLNPSPIKDYPEEIFDNATFVIVNEIEITKVKGYSEKAPLKILEKYSNKLIMTKGKDGCYYHNGKELTHIDSIKVDTIDTTGAGDTFLGSFMTAINNNMDIKNALQFATICAGLKTTKLGAQTAMPKLSEVKKYIKKNKINLEINF